MNKDIAREKTTDPLETMLHMVFLHLSTCRGGGIVGLARAAYMVAAGSNLKEHLVLLVFLLVSIPN